MSPDLAPLPEGAVLLHIGPFKTGSTAIQQALFDQRDVLAAHGVHYPGRWRRLFREGHSLMRWSPKGTTVPPESVWDDFAAGIRARPERVCISTEDFGRLRNPDRSRKIVADLGADRLHVLAVARAYHRLLPSHWQERVKSTETLTYDEWLRQVLEGDDSMSAHRSFWTSHDIDRMARQWLDVLPAERFTVVVSDDSDRLLLSRVFEQLLDLPTGVLAPSEGSGRSNQSLSANAAEVLRRLNLAFAERGWSERTYRQLVRNGVARGLQSVGRAEGDVPMPPLPTWASPLVLDRSRARIDAIRSLGLNVVGDLERLLPPDATADAPADVSLPDEVSVAAVAAGVVAALDASLQRSSGRGQQPARASRIRATGPPALSEVDGRTLVRELAGRARRRVRRPRGASQSPADASTSRTSHPG